MDMSGKSSPPSPPSTTSTDHTMMTMATSHMTFYWGKNAEILFSGWPGTRTGMYVLALVIVFVLALLVEFLSRCQVKMTMNKKAGNEDDKNGVVEGLVQVLLHALRVGLAYLIMLGLMSFNGGVFLVALAGHTIGFFLFQRRPRE